VTVTSTRPRLSEEDVAEHLALACFPRRPPALVGVELERHVVDPGQPDRPVPPKELINAGNPPSGSRVSFEPGGQVELSTEPCRGVSGCLERLAADLAHVSRAAADAGLTLGDQGTDPVRPPTRVIDTPRYAAQEEYWDRRGQGGRRMMCSTAATQVNLDVGRDPTDVRRRWLLANSLGPVLVAAFAHSPLLDGRPTGWKSTRQQLWWSLDPQRCRPPCGDDPVDAWVRFALDAPVMMLRRPHAPWVADPGFTLREWLRDGAPTLDDVDYHLTTLFPPVRPHGWLEIRYLDSLPAEYVGVAVTVLATLLDSEAAAAPAVASAAVSGHWQIAARLALSDPPLRSAAESCFAAAISALPDGPARRAVEDYADRYVAAGRCPADDVLEQYT
jgi:glutamate--cysteine ligase